MNLSKYINKDFYRKVSLSYYISWVWGIIGGLLLISCSENLDVRNAIEEIPDGTLLINLAIPDPITVETRANVVNEAAVNTLHIFIYSEDEKAFLQHQEINISSIANHQVSVPLNNSARNRQTSIYAVANLNLNDSEISEFQDLSKLKSHLLDDMNSENHIIDLGNGIPMIGSRKVNTASETIATISLYRVVAKITASVSAENYSLEEYQIYVGHVPPQQRKSR